MIPDRPLPCSEEFDTPDAYIEALLHFVSTNHLFQLLCGGVHILDFFTTDPGLFQAVVPEDWQAFLMACPPMKLLDILMRDDLSGDLTGYCELPVPASLVDYVTQIRRLTLRRDFTPRNPGLQKLPRHITVGMKEKKIHEVANFADYIHGLVGDIASTYDEKITHLIDFGSGQNYLGRTLASKPYAHNIVAVECREENILGAKDLDILAGIAKKPVIMRNKKMFMQSIDSKKLAIETDATKREWLERNLEKKVEVDEKADLRPRRAIGAEAEYERTQGNGVITYVEGRMESGDLTDIIARLDAVQLQEKQEAASAQVADMSAAEVEEEAKAEAAARKLMAISIHSCGNLSHYGIRSLVMNPSMRAVAIVGCCYNLMTERLGPPTYLSQYLRPTLQAINGRVIRESARHDPQGFPISDCLERYGGTGVRLNITARMMACQAPLNWGEDDSDEFFSRHFFRAVLQRIFLDYGVVSTVRHTAQGPDGQAADTSNGGDKGDSPFNLSTNPVIVGSLRKAAYKDLHAYVRGAIGKLTTNKEYAQYAEVVAKATAGLTDADIQGYKERYMPRYREMSAVWSLISFSAQVVESMIVTDRWQFLRENSEVVRDCWVEAVFDYKHSPRNLVVVGIKR
ncbi:hypothetical protein TD95_002185 [Thielaviopsis punctulata]|uniref:Methyltransferase domain-containing protein n=1 Tax=Thielaviopsis punctulata TaxID=72032 RepID=A0A0F4ZEJ6_9PEZI|nr:hypothetical protein TD95_002185 [Thielaviopsis punctulata]